MHRGWGAAPAMLCPRRAISGAGGIRELGLQVSLLENPSPLSMSVLWGVLRLCSPDHCSFRPVSLLPARGRGRSLGLCWGDLLAPPLPFLTCLCPGGGCSGVSCPGPAQSTGPLCLASLFSHLTRRPWKVSHLPAAQTFQAHLMSSCSPHVFQGSAVSPWSRGSFSWDTCGTMCWHAVEFCRPAGQQGYSVFVNALRVLVLRTGYRLS